MAIATCLVQLIGDRIAELGSRNLEKARKPRNFRQLYSFRENAESMGRHGEFSGCISFADFDPFALFVIRSFARNSGELMSNPSAKGRYEFEPLSYRIIGACIDVQRQMGVHCMEVDYQRALEIALPKFGVEFQREVEIPITYEGVTVTKRRVDFLCWDGKDECLVETKAASSIRPEDAEQCLLYVTRANHKLCLLVNFGEKPLRPRRFVNTPEGRAEQAQLSNYE